MEAAESIVAILIDHDHTVDEIKDAFKGDSDIKKALTAYLDNDKDYAEEEEEELDEEDNYNQEDDY
jgi:ribosome-interacting GTPase 1